MRPRLVPAIVCLLIIASNPAPATAQDRTDIDFETLARGEIVTDQFVAQGLRFRAVNWSHGPDHAVVFDTGNIGASDDEDLEASMDAAAGFEELGDLWPGNVLVLHERHDCTGNVCAEPDDEGSRPAGYLEFVFAGAVTLHGLTLIDANYETGDTPAQLVLFAVDGSVLESLDVPGVGGQGDWLPWQIERAGVARARLYLPGDAAIDNLAFTPAAAINWLPEFLSFPPIAVTPDGTYTYRPEIRDMDGDAVTLTLLAGPDGMFISDTGELQWSPADESGTFAVAIEATDGKGGVARQNFTVVSEEQFARLQEFEFATGTIVDDELLTDGLYVIAKNLSSGSDFAVAFDTEAPGGGDTDLAAPFEEGSNNDLDLGPSRPGKVLVLHEEHDCDVLDQSCAEPDDETTRPAGWIEFRFTQPAYVFSIDVFDITSDNPDARKVEFFDANDQSLTNLYVPRTGSNDWDRLLINVADVSRMRVNFDGDGAIDRLHYALLGNGDSGDLPPQANLDSYTVAQDEILLITAPGVLENDSDPNDDPLTAHLTAPPAHGVLVLNIDGGFTYTPALAFSGVDVFQYRARDAESESGLANVEIRVTPEPGAELPSIGYFFASPSQMYDGSNARLYWHVTGADTVRVDPGAHVVAGTGEMVVTPHQTTTYTLTAGNAAGEVTRSDTVTILEPEHFIIAFEWPAEGGGVSWQTPPLVLRIIDESNTIDFSRREIRIDGQSWNTNCYYSRFDQITCLPLAPIPVGTHVATARFVDYSGVPSNVATLNFYIDMTPPPAPDASRISATTPGPDGKVTITGASGAVEAGNTVQIQVLHYVANGVLVLPDGSFSTLMPAAAGAILQVRARDQAGNYSEFVAVEVPHPSPVISVSAPLSGALLNNNRPEIVVHYLQSGGGINYSSLSISVNGEMVSASCAHGVAESRCTPVQDIPEGSNTLAVQVASTNGVNSNSATVAFTTDTVSPTPVIAEKITLVQEPVGTVTVTGGLGAAEAAVAVTARHGDEEETDTSGPDGSFNMIVSAETAAELHLYARDAAGNTSEAVFLTVPPQPLHAEITSHFDGESVLGDHVIIRGHHNGGLNTGVVVNGVSALVSAEGGFSADVPLVPGTNQIVAVAGGFSGETGEVLITLMSDGAASLATLTALQNEGPAPIEVRFRVDYAGLPNALHHFEFDANGDGVPEQIFTDPETALSHVYTQPGWYEPRLAVFMASAVLETSAVVHVISASQMDAMFRELWNGWKNELIAGNTDAALAYISPARRERYRGTFDALSDRWPEIFDTFTSIEPAILTSGFTEYAVNRTINGENRLFLVYFAQDEYGVWRLHAF